MCGVVTIFGYGDGAPPVDEAELLASREAMRVRGPDGAAIWLSDDRRVGLAHRRLAIVDLTEAGAQPMATADGRLRVVFNGEIYNHRALRAGLVSKGYRFRSNSDTEVLLHLYADKGPEMLRMLRGMYAFALWDEVKRGLLLARDPFGIKPLYYADDGCTLRVASQAKALLKGGSVCTEPDPAGHVGFFLWGYVPEPFTLYKGVRALPAGSTLWVKQGGSPLAAPFCAVSEEIAAAERGAVTPGNELSGPLREALLDSVRHHLVSDVPVGLFLSAGIDSGALAALVSEVCSGGLHAVTLGFKEHRGTENDETGLAEVVAQRYGATHRTRWVTRGEFKGELDRLLAAMDQPSIDGVNTYLVSKAAAEAGLKVALSGLGGDELFAGYPSFRQIPSAVRVLRHCDLAPVGRAFRWVAAPVLERFTSPKYAGLLEYGGSFGGMYLLRRGLFMPWELPDLLDPEIVREGWAELQPLARLEETARPVTEGRLKVSALEMTWYMRNQLLRDADWAGMAHSVEIRVPLVDVELLRRLVPLLRGRVPLTKRALASAAGVPAVVAGRNKTGFAVPVAQWCEAASGNGRACERGLRGWARLVYARAVADAPCVRSSAWGVSNCYGGRERREGAGQLT